ncbi:MAG: Ig-like domain-containing protein, partial [Spirochaetaceae bacterium]|nr:Ig-like domain-containing protein [Spirochaetaceae bacterium]
MIGRKILNTIKITTLAVLIIFFGCSSPLMDIIEEEVEVVVTPPSILTLYPESDSTNIPVDIDNILITFSKNLNSSSVNSSTLFITNSEGTNVTGTYTVSNDTVTFTPSSNFSYETSYSVTVTSGILDVNGNNMTGDYSWSFNTEEAPQSILPIIQMFHFAEGKNSTNNPSTTLDIYATNYNGSTAGLQFRYKLSTDSVWSNWSNLTSGAGTDSVTLSVTTDETESFTYEAEVKNSSGIYSEIASTTITYETTPPTPLDVNWDDEDFYPFDGSLISITFDEEMDFSSFTDSNFTIEKVSDSSSVTGILRLEDSSTKTNAVAILWGLSFLPNTQYKVTLGDNVTDIAGNQIGEINEWYFITGDSTDVQAPEGTITLNAYSIGGGDGFDTVVTAMPNGALASNDYRIRLDLSSINDDYNTVWGMKFWGENNGTEENFETTATWELFPTSAPYTRGWELSTNTGAKFILYKLSDSAGNESEKANQIKIFLDDVPPTNPVLTINGGTGLYTNDLERKVDLEISAEDIHTGLYQMTFDDGTTSTSWIDWSPEYNDWQLPETDGLYTITVNVRDFLGTTSASPGNATITLDREAPAITINTSNILVNDDIQIMEGSAGTDIYETIDTYGIASYQWEQISGPGIIYFNSIDNGGSANDGTELTEPFVTASAEGVYYIQVTVTDNAGNSSSDVMPVTWDETSPENISNMTVTENNPGYSTTSQPTWEWDPSTDADFYRVTYLDDFVNSANYIDIDTAGFLPNTPLPDGSVTLYVKAYDFAGNSSNKLSQTVNIDTELPTVSVINYEYIANVITSNPTINFGGPDGSISDNIKDGYASGIASTIWTQTGGTGTVTFGNSTGTSTTVATDADGTFQITLTVTDNAGNISETALSLLRDLTIPETPVVTGTSLTPNLRPTWYWSSNGGGVGSYQYYLYNVTDSNVVTNWTATELLSFQPVSNLTDQKFYRLDVREYDAAGNPSSEGSYTIEVDSTQTTPAQILIGDGEPPLRTVNSVTWNVLSGSGGIATNYRYYYDGSGTWIYGGTGLDPSTPTVFNRTGLSEGNHSITIQEYFNSTWQTGKTASHSITVDTVAPSAPTLNGEGLATIDSDRTATKDNYPTWSWSTGGGGNGQYEYRL